ncbi:MAG: (Na+)-NQR maturation NqrM, partial [Bdellovibrionales bacterium]|nr:(Na+)-NQR maturation NqrM [Bdellovibrionales bacterium]
MKLFFITLTGFFTFALLMALGILFGRKPLQGSCGGLARLMGNQCEFCDDQG